MNLFYNQIIVKSIHISYNIIIMDEFNQDNYFFNTYYKSNHEDFTNKFSLKHSLNKKKYIDIENLDYDIESKNLLSFLVYY